MKKLLYLPLTDIGRPQVGLLEAFPKVFDMQVYDYFLKSKLGESLDSINVGLLDAIKSFNPDILHAQLHGADIIKPATLQAIRDLCPKLFMTHWHGDLYWPGSVTVNLIQKINPYFDLTLISNRGQLVDMVKYAGARQCKYWQVGVLTREPCPDHIRWPFDVVFTAQKYGDQFPNEPRREELARKLTEELGRNRFVVYGRGWGPEVNHANYCPYYEQMDCMASAKVVVSFSHTSTCHSYFSARMLWGLVSGACVVADWFPGCDDMFVDNKEILFFKTVNEAMDKVGWALANPVEAKAIGVAGRQRAINEHSWDVRVKEYVSILQEAGVKL